MAVQGPIPVEFASVFPRGVFAAGPFEPVRDFEASKGGRFVQSKDKQTGLPLWQADVIDADPQARDKTVRVKIPAADQPVLPAPHPGMPFVPVEFAGLTVTPYVNQAGRQAYSLKAAGVRVPRGGRERRGEGGRGVSGRESSASVSLQASTDAQVQCYTYADSGPILSVDAGRLYLTISAGHKAVPASGVTFARTLVREAQRFAAECERVHGDGQAQDAGTGAAGDAA